MRRRRVLALLLTLVIPASSCQPAQDSSSRPSYGLEDITGSKRTFYEMARQGPVAPGVCKSYNGLVLQPSEVNSVGEYLVAYIAPRSSAIARVPFALNLPTRPADQSSTAVGPGNDQQRLTGYGS